MVVRELASAQVDTWLFGGWAEELSGLCLPRRHQDIDLLYPAETFAQLDSFLLTSPQIQEVAAKRFAHKRAFRWNGVLVEVFLLCPQTEGYTTDFFGIHLFRWPEDTLFGSVSLLGDKVVCASPRALSLYRHQHGIVEQAYKQYTNNTQSICRRVLAEKKDGSLSTSFPMNAVDPIDSVVPVTPLLNIILLYARDMQKTAAFYQKHFGFTSTGEVMEGILELNPMVDGGARILIYQAGKGVKLGQAGVKLTFSVPDVEAFKAVAAAAGLTFGSTHQANGYTFANAKDPDGNSVSISSRQYR